MMLYSNIGQVNCPAQIGAGKNGITWAKFKQMVQGTSHLNQPQVNQVNQQIKQLSN